jgi:hypothetical protein
MAQDRAHLRFRIESHLQKQLEKARQESGRTLTAEITERLKKSFTDEVGDLRAEWRKGLEDLRAEWAVHFKVLRTDVRDVPSDVASEIDFSEISSGLDEVQSQIRAILSHLGLPDPVEEEKARQKAEYEARRARRATPPKDEGEKK